MRERLKIIAAAFITVIMFAVIAPFASVSLAAEVTDGYIDGGNCGSETLEDVKWSFYEDGTLVIEGEGAFSVGWYMPPWDKYQSDIKHIIVGEGVTNIPSTAFCYTENATTISIPSTVSEIGSFIFWSSNLIEEFSVAEDSPYYSVVDGVLFNKEKTKLIMYPHDKKEEIYNIPDTVDTIGEYAFSFSSNIKVVDIPDSVYIVGDSAFYASEIEAVNFGKNVSEICDSAFSRVNIKTIVLPEKLTTICANMFWSCTELKHVVIGKNVKEIKESAFGYARNLSTIHYEGTEDEWKEVIKPEELNNGTDTLDVHFGELSQKDIVAPDCGNDGWQNALYCETCKEYVGGIILKATGDHKYENSYCPVCKQTCDHSKGYENGICVVCNFACKHDGSEKICPNAYCKICEFKPGTGNGSCIDSNGDRKCDGCQETIKIDVKIIKTGKTTVKGSDYVYYQFVPEKDGEYIFVSEGNADPYIEIYDEEWNWLESDNDSSEMWNFRLAINLEASKVYYIQFSDTKTDKVNFNVEISFNEHAVADNCNGEHVILHATSCIGEFCKYCGVTDASKLGDHVWTEGICNLCNASCEHTFTEGICEKCKMIENAPVIYVGGVYVNGDNYTDILGDKDTGATASYDIAANKLILENYEFVDNGQDFDSVIDIRRSLNLELKGVNNITCYQKDAIYLNGEGTTLNLIGNGTLNVLTNYNGFNISAISASLVIGDKVDVFIDSSANGICGEYDTSAVVEIKDEAKVDLYTTSEGIYLYAQDAEIIIKGNASVSIDGKDECFYVDGYNKSSVIIEENANISGINNDEEGICLYGDEANISISDNAKVYLDVDEEGIEAGNVFMKGGYLEAHGKKEYQGISADKLAISGGVVKAYAEDAYAIEAEDIDITGGYVIASTKGEEYCAMNVVPDFTGYTGNYKTVASKQADGKSVVSYKKADNESYKFVAVTCTNHKLKGFGNYKAATLTQKGISQAKYCTVCQYVAVHQKEVYSPKTFTLSKTSYTYNTKVQTPSVTVKDSKGNILKKDTDYTVKNESGRKNPGKYTVTVTFKGNYSGTKTLTYTIAPKVTSKISATQTTNTITLKWNKVTGADGYRVYRYNTQTKKYVQCKDVTGTTLKISNLKAGTGYKYKVRAFTKDDGTIWGAYSTVFETATKCKAPTLKTLTSTKGKANFTWTNVSGETGYQVYFSTKKNSNFKLVNTYKTNVLKGSKSKLTKGKTYYFKVRAYKKTASGKVYSAWSPVKSVKIK